LKTILNEGREFLVRIDDTMTILIKDKKQEIKDNNRQRGRKKVFPGRKSVSIASIIKKKKAIICNHGKLWILPNVIIKAWSGQVKSEGSVIVFRKNGFKNPMVIYFSETSIDVEKASEMVQMYYQRWKIEQIFKELKQLFHFENFKVTTLTAIYRYLYLCILAHTLLGLKKRSLELIEMLKNFIEFYLKRKRKIYSLKVDGLKIFYEKCHERHFDFQDVFPLFIQCIHHVTL